MLLLSITSVGSLLLLTLISISFRRIVSTNEVHIIQSNNATTSYGKDTKNGNVYYEWPAWIPLVGITKIILPVSVFKIELQSYEAYDVGRVPFEVDVVAFFRIEDSNISAQRVSSFKELQDQLLFILRGAVRTILASHDIDRIMVERSTFGEAFTKEVEGQLPNWGITTVKNIELMDIRDGKGDQVVHNIMQKKKSFIEMQSRSEVANNIKDAEIAEIKAKRDSLLQRQQAEEEIGKRTAEKDQAVGISNQQAQQAIKEQEKLTKEKEMSVLSVAQVRQAEITRSVTMVQADQSKQTTVIIAEGQKQTNILTAEGAKTTTVLQAEGNLEARKREAEGTQLVGEARAKAEQALQLAPVMAQITLAKEIGNNGGYQTYLTTMRQIEANQEIGVEQAHALQKADIKVIANTGSDIAGGITDVRSLLSPKGGTALASMIEGFGNTPQGAKIVEKFMPSTKK